MNAVRLICIHLILTILVVVGLYAPVEAMHQSPPEPAAPADWSTPAPVGALDWPDLRYFSLSDDGTRLVGLDYQSGGDNKQRNVVATEYVGGAWQPLTVIAQNGVYDTGIMIWLPQYTHPVISGDGATIVYLGWTGETHAPYVVDRLPGGGWSAPALIPTGPGNTHYWLSLSQDGRTLALASYSFFGIDQVYVQKRTTGGWSALNQVSVEDGPTAGGRFPSLSTDGRRLVYIQNARATFVEQIDGEWTAPVQLTINNHWEGDEVEYPQMSGDGRAVIYWLVHNEGGTLTTQDLYIVRRTGDVWSAPQKVSTLPNAPITDVSRAPAAASREATRLIYAQAISTNTASGPAAIEGVFSSDLLISEWRDGAWQETQLVATDGWTYNWWPRLSPDGMTLTYKGGAPIKRMTTDTPPTPPTPLPLPTSTTATITPVGGELYSEIDQTHYDFAPGTFTETVQFTHTVWSNLPPPPPGHVTIDGIGGGLSRGFEAAALLGPGGPLLQPTRPVTVTIDYDDDKPSIIIPGTRRLWRLDVDDWVQLPGVDDPEQATLTTLIDHFSYFAVFGETHYLYLPTVGRG